MKAIFCGHCGDVRALIDGETVTCRCGNVSGRWEVAALGLARVRAKNRELARVIGIDNRFLYFTFEGERKEGEVTLYPTNAEWYLHHQACVNSAEGLIFHRMQRACPFAVFRVGQTNDVKWEDD